MVKMFLLFLSWYHYLGGNTKKRNCLIQIPQCSSLTARKQMNFSSCFCISYGWILGYLLFLDDLWGTFVPIRIIINNFLAPPLIIFHDIERKIASRNVIYYLFKKEPQKVKHWQRQYLCGIAIHIHMIIVLNTS